MDAGAVGRELGFRMVKKMASLSLWGSGNVYWVDLCWDTGF